MFCLPLVFVEEPSGFCPNPLPPVWRSQQHCLWSLTIASCSSAVATGTTASGSPLWSRERLLDNTLDTWVKKKNVEPTVEILICVNEGGKKNASHQIYTCLVIINFHVPYSRHCDLLINRPLWHPSNLWL